MNLPVQMLCQLIKTRRTIHRFKADLVDPAIIQEALGLMQFVPNHHLLQSWQFYVVGACTKNKLLKIAQTSFALKNSANAAAKIARWAKIPHWIMVTQNIQDKSDQQIREEYASISTGLYAMMLFLHNQGIGSKWSTGSIIHTEDWLAACTIDSCKEKVVGLFWIGYPEDIHVMPPRRTPDHYIKILD